MFLDPGWIILILLVVLLIMGLPIAFVLGVTAAVMIEDPVPSLRFMASPCPSLGARGGSSAGSL